MSDVTDARPSFTQWLAGKRAEQHLAHFLSRPPSAIVRMAPPTETFGHEPEWINVGYCGGCERCGDRQEERVCGRCWSEWPCGTAKILNLVDEDDELVEPFASRAATDDRADGGVERR